MSVRVVICDASKNVYEPRESCAVSEWMDTGLGSIDKNQLVWFRHMLLK